MESCLWLDVNQLNKFGCLQPGYRGGLEWSRDGQRVGSIGLRAMASQLAVTYRLQLGGDWEDVEEAVSVRWSPCRFGGMRPYFSCPGVIGGRLCCRLVTKLYLGGRYFLCRHCYDLAYASQSEAWHYRLQRRARKHEAALGARGTGILMPPKPKGMHWRTYARHVAGIDAAEAAVDQVLASWRP